MNDGLSSSGDHYREAIDYLLTHYSRPHLIHQAHVHAIHDTPAIKKDCGKELQSLLDIVNQHFCALKAMEYEASGHFVTCTSMLELKLDANSVPL